MTSVNEICNLALSNIGKPAIASFDEASEEARQCRLHYAITRDTVLQSYPWRFARKMQSLAEAPNTWEERWRHAYTRPVDCLKPIRIIPCVDIADDIHDVPFNVGHGFIFCDLSPARLEYTSRFEDPTYFPPLFQDALAWALATRMAMPLTRDQSIRKDSFQMASQTVSAAQFADADEEINSYDFPSSLIEARR